MLYLTELCREMKEKDKIGGSWLAAFGVTTWERNEKCVLGLIELLNLNRTSLIEFTFNISNRFS